MVRENIYNAVYNKLKNIPGFVTVSRRERNFADVPSIDQPALFIRQVSEVAQLSTKMPTKWTFTVQLILMANSGSDPDTVPSQILNPLIDAVDNTFRLDPVTGAEQTLDGLVERCRIEGMGNIYEGTMENQAIVSIILTIFLGAS